MYLHYCLPTKLFIVFSNDQINIRMLVHIDQRTQYVIPNADYNVSTTICIQGIFLNAASQVPWLSCSNIIVCVCVCVFVRVCMCACACWSAGERVCLSVGVHVHACVCC
jgi:hypothetical protein